eukprot:10757074-Ditylum_brightwellii.AAC.1
MYAESFSEFLEEVPSSKRDFLFNPAFPPHIGSFFCNLLLEMCLKKMLFLKGRAYLDKEVSILNLLPPDLLLDGTTAWVSAEKTAVIKDMIDMPTAKRSKMSTTMNTIGLCKTKENTLSRLAITRIGMAIA